MSQKMVRPKYRHGTLSKGNQKPVVVAGSRTAFVKSFGDFKETNALELLCRAIDGLMYQLDLDPHEIDEIIAGAVVPQAKNPNIARDAIINLKLPHHIHGFSLNQACASSLQAVALAAKTIAFGQPQLIVAGGVESLSQVPIVYNDGARQTLIDMTRARSLRRKLKAVRRAKLAHWLPSPPPLAEPLTGLTMGQHAEIMAEKNNISRAKQDQFAMNSHHKAAAAQAAGVLTKQITPIWPSPRYQQAVSKDNIIRADSSLKALAKLKPVFAKPFGTITAGNSSPLTDGAAVTLVCDEHRARSLSLQPLVEIIDVEFVGVDPYDQLLIGPALAIPRLLQRHRLKLEDIDRFEIHEAFAAQMVSCLEALDSPRFFDKYFGTRRSLGQIPDDKLNVYGGAIAIGHPFGASGARLINTLAFELNHQNLEYGLVAMCAAGGMAGAMLVRNCDHG